MAQFLVTALMIQEQSDAQQVSFLKLIKALFTRKLNVSFHTEFLLFSSLFEGESSDDVCNLYKPILLAEYSKQDGYTLAAIGAKEFSMEYFDVAAENARTRDEMQRPILKIVR